jgi:hypothetical protein
MKIYPKSFRPKRSFANSIPDVTELTVRNVFDVDPLDLELAFKLVLHPNTSAAVVVDGRKHFRHAAKVSGPVHGEQKVDGPLVVEGPVGRVQPLVAVVGGAPDLVLDAAVDVVLAEALDDEEARVLWVQVEAFRVVLVRAAKVLENRVTLGRVPAR